MKKIILSFLTLMLVTIGYSQDPISDAPTPPNRNAVDVVSIFSGAYTDIAGVNLNPNWGQAGHADADTNFDRGSGDISLKYPKFNYQGIDFDGNRQNVSGFEKVHIDIWTGSTAVRFFLIWAGGEVSVDIAASASWQSLDFDLSAFTGADLSTIRQLKFDGGDGSTSTIYVDNIYFWKSPAAVGTDATLSDLKIDGTTINGFAPSGENYKVNLVQGVAIPQITLASTTDASATTDITQATSVPGDATVVVTAADGTTTKTYTISFDYTIPNTEAPTPTIHQDNVISIFSDAYTPPGNPNYNPNWGQTGLGSANTNFDINSDGDGNAVLAYPNFNYQGMEFTPFDASTYDYIRMDIWTPADPTATDIQISPINDGTGTRETLVSITYTSKKWISVALPKSSFTGMTWDKVIQFKIAANGAGSTNPVDIYVDNIYFSKSPNDDATLIDLKIDGTTISGFASNVEDYTVNLAIGTTTVPTVTATATSPRVTSAVVTPATSIPGDAKIEVTAEDGTTTKTYTVSFDFVPNFNNIPTGTGYYINKIIASPSGSDLTNEYFEFRGPANALVPDDLYFIAIEGDGESSSLSKVSEAIKLGDGIRKFGSNGMLSLIANYTETDVNPNVKTTNTYTSAIASGTTIITIELEGNDVTSSSSSAVTSRDPDIGYDGNISDASATYMLIAANSAPKNVKVDQFLNSDGTTEGNDGIIDATGDHTGWTLYDSVSYLDDDGHGKDGEYGYGQIIFTQPPTNAADRKTTTSATIVDHKTTSDINYLFRQGTKTGFTTNDWVGSANGSNSKVPPNWVLTTSDSKINRTYFKGFAFNTNSVDATKVIPYGALNPVEPNTWDGSTNTDWAIADNWSLDIVPNEGSDVTIPNVANDPVIEAATTAYAHTLTINSDASLTTDGTLNVSNNATYIRNLATTNWYLVSSPVTNETYDDAYVTANDIALGTSDNRGIATYTTSTDTWSYMQAGSSNTFTNGKGYSVKRASAGDISFTGTLSTGKVSVAIDNTGNSRFNLIGNPYATHINSGNFLTDNNNTAKLEAKTIWVWDQSTNTYEAKTATMNFKLAPAQGFFVQAKVAATDNLTFDYSAIKSTGGTFQKTDLSQIKLLISDGISKRLARILYYDTATKGFDNGGDGETFSGYGAKNTKFNVYTCLLNNDKGKKYQVQSLPKAGIENMIIPVGVKSEAGKEITFSLETLNLPSGVKIFLEDRETGITKRLDEAGANYKVEPKTDLNGIGRFYISSSAAALNIDDNTSSDDVSVYNVDNSKLRIVGLSNGEQYSFSLFNLLGNKLVNNSFSSNGVKDISLPKLTTGIYIASIESKAGRITKKIIIE